MRRLLACIAPALALFVLAAFAVELGVGYGEEAGLVCCGDHSFDPGSPSDGGDHCPPHHHLNPLQLPHFDFAAESLFAGLHAFGSAPSPVPDGPALAIDQPPKIA